MIVVVDECNIALLGCDGEEVFSSSVNTSGYDLDVMLRASVLLAGGKVSAFIFSREEVAEHYPAFHPRLFAEELWPGEGTYTVGSMVPLLMRDPGIVGRRLLS